MAYKGYIERGALKQLFYERFHTAFIQEKTRENPEYWRGVCTGINWGVNTILDVPAADVVAVVRCKDCKHRETSECPMVFYETISWDDDGYLETDTITHDNTEDDDFCSYGERKEQA